MGKQGCPFHGIFQLAQVAGPCVALKGFAGFCVKSNQVSFQFAVCLVQKEISEKQDVFGTFFQVGHAQRKFVDAVIQVFAEGSFGNPFFQVFVGGAEQADVHFDFLGRPDAADAPFLQGTQQLDLYLISQVPYFVQKKCASVGFFECAGLVSQGTGKRAFDVPEEFGGSKFFRYRAAVDGNKRFSVPLAKLMDAVGYILFSCSARTGNQHRHLGRGYQPHIVEQLMRGFAFSFQKVLREGCRCFFLQVSSRYFGFPDIFLYLVQQFVRVDRFGDVVACPVFHGLYGTLYLGIAGHDNKRSMAGLFTEPCQQVNAVLVGQA